MYKLGRLLWISISVLTIIIAISVTISNAMVITLSLWPFSQTLDVPIWLLAIAAFVIGGMLSGGLMWLQMLTSRAKLWRSQSKVLKLQAQLEHQRQESRELKLMQSVDE